MTFAFPKPAPRIKERKFSSLPTSRAERRSGRDRDPAYLSRVRRLPCYAKRAFPAHICAGRIEADHMGPRPLGRKCHDREAVPMCQQAHWERTNYTGMFKDFSGAEMRAWCDVAIAYVQLCLGYVSKEAP